jgi:general secretion pathway protein J
MNGGSPSPRPRTHAAGFTLVELLIALAIVGALLVTAFGALRVALGAWRQGEERTDAHQHIRSVATVLARSVGAAYPYRGTVTDSPEIRLLFRGEAARLEFVTSAAPFPLAAPVAFTAVVISFEEGEGLVIRERALPNGEPFTEAAVVLRDAGVTSLALRYMDDGQQWQSTWDDDTTAPTAVEITVGTVLNGRRETLPPLTVALPIATE